MAAEVIPTPHRGDPVPANANRAVLEGRRGDRNDDSSPEQHRSVGDILPLPFQPGRHGVFLGFGFALPFADLLLDLLTATMSIAAYRSASTSSA